MARPIYRFAPSPNGRLHLGHAFCALLNEKRARDHGGLLLLRLEDIDAIRCTAELCQQAIDDLRWLGLNFEPGIRFQSHHGPVYQKALGQLHQMGLLYGCACTRSDRERDGVGRPLDPDHQPLYSGKCRALDLSGPGLAYRLDLAKALKRVDLPITYSECGTRHEIDPSKWGDIVLARRDIGLSYHIAVVTDDALQGVTHIVRGADLQAATAIHRLLQMLLGLPEPAYEHHRLILHETGRKLAKSEADRSLAELREQGVSPYDIRKVLGFAT